jgi:predicted TIM-barrel fold metal-dependent hydrolase
MASFMLRMMGLPGRALSGNFDQLYVERVLRMVRESSLGAAVLLAQDDVYNEQGQKTEGVGSFYVPNHYVLQLAKKHPEFLPAVSIHPARPDALEELEQCLADGAVMMKCLPNCHNIDCNNRRYTRFWERMAEAGLPLLAHTGGEHTLPVVRPELANPRVLELPLQCGVKVIAAHCGTKSGLRDPDYFSVFVAMVKQYPRFYGDNSAFNVPIRGRHVRECLVEPIASRIFHGSDFPVPVLGHWSWLSGLITWKTFRQSQRLDNTLERDYFLKRAMGFKAETFTGIKKLLRMASTREEQATAQEQGNSDAPEKNRSRK